MSTNPNISIFANARSKEPGETLRFAGIINKIRTSRDLAEKVDVIRKAPTKDEADELKKELPAFTTSGEFSVRNATGLLKYSQVVGGDIDNVGPERAPRIRDDARNDPHCLAAFVSPSGNGVKLSFPVTTGQDQHRIAWENAANHVEKKYGVKVDRSGSDLPRLCFVSSDPGAWYNPDAVPLPIAASPADKTDAAAKDSAGGVTDGFEFIRPRLEDWTLEDTKRLFRGYRDPSAKRDEWLRGLGAIKHQHGDAGLMLALEWSSKGDNFESEEDVRRDWKSLKENPTDKIPSTMESLVREAQAKGFVWGSKADLVGLTDGGVILPGDGPKGGVNYVATARALPRMLTNSNIYSGFGVVSEVGRGHKGDLKLEALKAEGAATRFQQFVQFFVWRRPDEKWVLALVSKPPLADMKELLAGGVFAEGLRKVELVSGCPILVEDASGKLHELNAGYHAEHRVLIDEKAPHIKCVEFDEARNALLEILQDFCFETPADFLRAIADILTPALVMGGILGCQAPVSITEANASQAGKGYLQKIVRAIYRALVDLVTDRTKGVGGFDENLSEALQKAQTFIPIDNYRGKMDSPFFEAALTAEKDAISTRTAYRPVVAVSVRRRIFQITSNGLEATPDLANRANRVGIRKQPNGYQFKRYAEGGLLEHVEANQPYYLGCVFAVVREWHAAGKPRTNETRHDRRIWAQSLDWILDRMFMGVYGSMMDGVGRVKERMASPSLSWLRAVCIAIAKDDLNLVREWVASDLDALCRDAEPAIAIPGDRGREGDGARAIGALLGQLFKKSGGQPVECEGFSVSRTSSEAYDSDRYETVQRHAYRFARSAAPALEE